MRDGRARAQLLVIAASLLLFVVVQVALAGPGARESGSTKAKLRSLSRQVVTLQRQVATLQGDVGAIKAGGLPPGGAAGGDLAGSYPAPSLRPPDAPISAGLLDFGASCSASPPMWYQYQPLTYGVVGAYRDRQGRVFLQGAPVRCNGPSATTFTLPAGYRPATTSAGIGVGGLGAPEAVTIQSSGAVTVNVAADAAPTILSAISFRCGPSGLDGCP